MRFVEKLLPHRLAAKLNGAYRRFLKDDDHKLVIRDIVGFSKLGLYEPGIEYTSEQLIEIRGRQQMALHILRHLDIDAVSQMEHQHDAQYQGSYLNEEQNNGR